MTRFFSEHVSLPTLTLQGQQAAHARVLRLKPGEPVVVCDGAGTEYLCTVAELTEEALVLSVGQAQTAQSEPRVAVTVYMALSKADKFEHVIQKATELGAAELVAFPSARCVSRPDAKSLPKKQERWQKIAASAAEQSGRGIIPRVRVLSSYREALLDAAQKELAVFFYENERAHTFRRAIEATDFRTAALLTGPEGGFTPQEVAEAEQAGLQVCTLGSRILRCETAPLCALSALMYAVGEF